jgi:hypothetical protein
VGPEPVAKKNFLAPAEDPNHVFQPVASRFTVISYAHNICIYVHIKPLTVICILGAGITQWYGAGLRAGCSGVRVPVAAGNFSHHRIQTGSGIHPSAYPVGTRGSFPGGKAAGA